VAKHVRNVSNNRPNGIKHKKNVSKNILHAPKYARNISNETLSTKYIRKESKETLSKTRDRKVPDKNISKTQSIAELRSRKCTIEELGAGKWENATGKLDKPFSSVAGIGEHWPEVWATENCTYDTYDSKEATKLLSQNKVFIVGDSVSRGIYDEISLGVLTDYTFKNVKKNLIKFRRINTLNVPIVDKILHDARGTTTMIINTGAHEAKNERFACSYDTAYLETIKYYSVNVTKFAPNKNFNYAKTKTLQPTKICLKQCWDVAKKIQKTWLESLTKIRKHYTGTMIFRTTQINFAFNKNGQENCIKMQLNEWLRSAPELKKMNVRILDIEKLTGSRPETFVHELTNHFYCQCKSGDARVKNRCKTTECIKKRTNVFENGEPNRYLAQLHLYALTLKLYG
jgi:hypothetical protein